MSEPDKTLWPHIYGHFDFQAVYDRFAEIAKPGDVFVEVGCLLGKSACYLGEKLKKRNATLVCVDTWPDHYVNEGGVVVERTYDSFCANCRQSGLSDVIVPMRMTSLRAASLLCNGLAAVFIDADHTYEAVKADIAAWRVKIRSGGLIAGHDFGYTYPGVKQAVAKFYGDSVSVIGQSWVHVIP